MSVMKCNICLEEFTDDSFIQLKCEHFFCKFCLNEDWTQKIQGNQINEASLKCPFEGCNQPINYYVLKTYLPPELFEKYDNLLSHYFEVTNTKEERSIICPDATCQTKSMIWKDADYFQCPTCKNTYCSNEECFGLWEKHQNLICLDYKKKYGNKNEENFERLLQKKGWKHCPKCHAIIEKISNCNTVRCESLKCQKKTIFCYLCGQLLKENEVSTHFLKGEFKNLCKNNVNQNNLEEIADSSSNNNKDNEECRILISKPKENNELKDKKNNNENKNSDLEKQKLLKKKENIYENQTSFIAFIRPFFQWKNIKTPFNYLLFMCTCCFCCGIGYCLYRLIIKKLK